jgi:hypothetical protein
MNSRGRAEGASDVQRLLLDVAGPIWKDLRSEALAALASARSLSAVQQNAYQMLSWFDYLLRKEYGLPYAQAAEQLLKDDELRKALWTAAIAHPLNPRAVGSLSNLPDHLAKMGLSIELPEWWTRTIDKLGLGSKNSIVPSESVQE